MALRHPAPRTPVLWAQFALCLALILAGHAAYGRSATGRSIRATQWGLNIRHYSKLLGAAPAAARRTLERSSSDDRHGIAFEISPDSGIYDGPIDVAVRTAPPARIHYSTDGSVPTSAHPRLEGPLRVDTTTVLRFRIFGAGPGPTATRSYVLDETAGHVAFSLVTDPVYLFDKHAGIYRNPLGRGRAWERPVRFAVLSPDGPPLESDARMRIHGDYSRRGLRKSFRLYLGPERADLRSWFGPLASEISPGQSEWVLRHALSENQIYRDRLGVRLARQLGLEASPTVPGLLYVNGELWGVYDLMERVNPAFPDAAGGRDGLTLLRGALHDPARVAGDGRDWAELFGFLAEHPLDDPGRFAAVADTLDLDNLIDYWILQIFSADTDRPHNNIDIYRASAPAARWRFLVWDLDGGFNFRGAYVEHDTLAWHLRDRPRPDLKLHGTSDSEWRVQSTLLFRRLMGNAAFRSRFRDRFELLLDTTLSPPALARTFETLLDDYAGLRPYELRRFPDLDPGEADRRLDLEAERVREFLARRPAVLRALLSRHVPLDRAP